MWSLTNLDPISVGGHPPGKQTGFPLSKWRIDGVPTIHLQFNAIPLGL